MLEVLSVHRVLAMWVCVQLPRGLSNPGFGALVGNVQRSDGNHHGRRSSHRRQLDSELQPERDRAQPVGTMTLTSTDCTHGKIDFNSVRGYGSGSMNLLSTDAAAGLTCP
jgi:hypothetical protein